MRKTSDIDFPWQMPTRWSGHFWVFFKLIFRSDFWLNQIFLLRSMFRISQSSFLVRTPDRPSHGYFDLDFWSVVRMNINIFCIFNSLFLKLVRSILEGLFDLNSTGLMIFLSLKSIFNFISIFR